MQLLTQILKQINDYVWGLPLICLLLGTGIYFTFKLRLIHIQNKAPGPPAAIAVATPTIFPVPIVEESAVHKA